MHVCGLYVYQSRRHALRWQHTRVFPPPIFSQSRNPAHDLLRRLILTKHRNLWPLASRVGTKRTGKNRALGYVEESRSDVTAGLSWQQTESPPVQKKCHKAGCLLCKRGAFHATASNKKAARRFKRGELVCNVQCSGCCKREATTYGRVRRTAHLWHH